MGKHSPRKRSGAILGSIVGLFILIGITGSYQQTPTANLTTTPDSGKAAQSSNNGTDAASSQTLTPSDASSSNGSSISTPAPAPAPSDSSSTDTSSSDTGLSDTNLSNDNSYTNVDGTTAHSPADSTDGSIPVGATAQCADGTYSFSQHHSGTCSHHGGVSSWL